MNVDLHCHSLVSDGALSPRDVVRRAAERGVELIALTDHDHLGGLAEGREAARECGIGFVDGIEISVTWRSLSVHIVGLDIDPFNAELESAIARVREGRLGRAREMAVSLERAGIHGCLEGALRHAGREEMIGRAHFARYLVDAGFAPDTKAVFGRFLVPGTPGFAEHRWAELEPAVRWIRAAGGVAVLAHPGRYGLSSGAMDALLRQFRVAGGTALEVVTGAHSAGQYREFSVLGRHHGLEASRGSDFHAPGEGTELGGLPRFEHGLRDVWCSANFPARRRERGGMSMASGKLE